MTGHGPNGYNEKALSIKHQICYRLKLICSLDWKYTNTASSATDSAGDLGVSDIVSLVWAGTAHASGTVIIGLCKPLWTIPIPATGLYSKMDFLNAFPSLPRIRDGANIQFLMFQTGATTSAGSVLIDFDYGFGG